MLGKSAEDTLTAPFGAGVAEEVYKGVSRSLWPKRQEDNCDCTLFR